jgi:hypothetical protein
MAAPMPHSGPLGRQQISYPHDRHTVSGVYCAFLSAYSAGVDAILADGELLPGVLGVEALKVRPIDPELAALCETIRYRQATDTSGRAD